MIEGELLTVKEQVRQYREIENIILSGDLYRLCNPLEANYFCEW